MREARKAVQVVDAVVTRRDEQALRNSQEQNLNSSNEGRSVPGSPSMVIFCNNG